MLKQKGAVATIIHTTVTLRSLTNPVQLKLTRVPRLCCHKAVLSQGLRAAVIALSDARGSIRGRGYQVPLRSPFFRLATGGLWNPMCRAAEGAYKRAAGAEKFGLTTHKYTIFARVSAHTTQLSLPSSHFTAFGEWLRLLQCAMC